MRLTIRATLASVVGLLLCVSLGIAVADEKPSGKVTIYVAASLSDLFKKAKAEFERLHPGTEILIEPGGSLVLIRRVAELQGQPDIIVVADHTLIPTYLVPKFVDRSTDFLTEQISIIAAENAKFGGEINSQNWFEVLLRPGVEVGISDPQAAPIGYRTLMVWKLAEQHYKRPGLFDQLSAKVPKKNIRPNAAAIMPLVKTGELDYIFDYPSLARQHGLRVIDLPAEIDLGDPRLGDRYKAVSVEIPGAEPGTKKSVAGAPIVYSIAPLKNAQNPKTAQAFVDYLLRSGGRDIMAQLGMTPIDVK